MEISVDRCMYEVESGSTLKLACPDNSPETFGSLPACFTSCALRDMTVDHYKANRLFSKVIRGLHPGGCNEGEIGFTMFTKTIGHVLGVSF